MKLLANSPYGYPVTDCNRHSITKCTNDLKTHAAINSKKLQRLAHIHDQLYQVELAKSEIEHKTSIFVSFCVLQYAKLRMLELYYNFSTKICSFDKYEEVEMDADAQYSALAEKEL